ncbi:hypothetical protein Tco_0939882 [Tanacetum coccineum]|uniref:Uncharacterized protein n=1 Tax=Tanacetum coccineum TaxID=301880 RepID=A0ABQ5DLT6_9ASTR
MVLGVKGGKKKKTFVNDLGFRDGCAMFSKSKSRVGIPTATLSNFSFLYFFYKYPHSSNSDPFAAGNIAKCVLDLGRNSDLTEMCSLPYDCSFWTRIYPAMNTVKVKELFSQQGDGIRGLIDSCYVVNWLLKYSKLQIRWKPSREFTRLLGPPRGLKGLLHTINATVIPTKDANQAARKHPEPVQSDALQAFNGACDGGCYSRKQT